MMRFHCDPRLVALLWLLSAALGPWDCSAEALEGCPPVVGKIVGVELVVQKGLLPQLIPENKEVIAGLVQKEGLFPPGFHLERVSAYFVPEGIKVAQRCPLDKDASGKFLQSDVFGRTKGKAKAGRRLMKAAYDPYKCYGATYCWCPMNFCTVFGLGNSCKGEYCLCG